MQILRLLTICWITFLSAAAVAEEPSLYVCGSWSGYWLQRDLVGTFAKAAALKTYDVFGDGNDEWLENLNDDYVNVVVISPIPGEVPERFGTDKELAGASLTSIGQFVVYVVVNERSQVRELTCGQIAGLFSGRMRDWQELRSHVGPVSIVCEKLGTKCQDIIDAQIFDSREVDMPVIREDDDKAIIARVARDRNAIGLFLSRHQPVAGVRLVAVSATPEGPYVAPTPENIFARRYPLSQELYLAVRADASKVARDYVRFALSAEAAGMAKERFLYSEYDRQQWLAERRLADVKAGKGDKLSAGGEKAGAALLESLATDYVKAKAAVQLRYAPGQQFAAVARFVETRDQELLLLDAKLSDETMAKYGAKWVALWPAKHLVGSHAVAVVVHPLNNVDALSRDQLQAIYTGKLRDWWNLPATAKTEIHRFGLAGTDPLAKLFDRVIIADGKQATVTRKEATAEVLAAVALDPQGIGFVNLAEIPPGEKSVKVLAIGPEGTPAPRSPADIVTKDYPLAQQWTLYVSPRAGATAKDFAAFVASAECAETLRRHGIVPSTVMGREKPGPFAGGPSPKPAGGEKPVFVAPKAGP